MYSRVQRSNNISKDVGHRTSLANNIKKRETKYIYNSESLFRGNKEEVSLLAIKFYRQMNRTIKLILTYFSYYHHFPILTNLLFIFDPRVRLKALLTNSVI